MPDCWDVAKPFNHLAQQWEILLIIVLGRGCSRHSPLLFWYFVAEKKYFISYLLVYQIVSPEECLHFKKYFTTNVLRRNIVSINISRCERPAANKYVADLRILASQTFEIYGNSSLILLSPFHTITYKFHLNSNHLYCPNNCTG